MSAVRGQSNSHRSDGGLVLFLGMVRRGEFESLENKELPLGILVDTNSKARLGDVSKFTLVEPFDFSRPLSDLVDKVKAIQNRFGIACLYNVIEFYVAQTAQVAAALGLPGLSPESARLSLNKNLMRQRFVDRIGSQAVARFHAIQSESDLLRYSRMLGFPCFLQPANVSASMWATRNPNQEILLQNYRLIVNEVPKYYERLGKKETTLSVALAEFLVGKNISIDCLADSQGKVYTTPAVEVLTGVDVGQDDYHHFARLLPPRLDESEKAQLDELAIAGVRALDMTSAAAHVEFIGTKLGEIGARPGGNRPRILEMAYGMDMLHAYYQILRGETPNLKKERNLAAAIVTPFAPGEGKFGSLRQLDRIPKLPGYAYHEVRAQPGQLVGPAKGGHRAGLYIELQSESADNVRRSVDEIASWTDLYQLE